MCNLYSELKPRQAVRDLFHVSDNRAATFDPLAAIFPAGDAPIVRAAEDGEREIAVLSWGFPLLMTGKPPKRVTNVRDDKLASPFWADSFRNRRCLVPATSFAEPKGRRPATWHWFALSEERPLFAFAGVWRRYRGPLTAGGESVTVEVYAFMTTAPNPLVATVHPSRMPVMLTQPEEWECWLNGPAEEARALVRTFPAQEMAIVQSGPERRDVAA